MPAPATSPNSIPLTSYPALPQNLVHLPCATVVSKAMVHKFSVNYDFVRQLLGQAFQSFALVRSPVVLRDDTIHGFGHALFIGNQRLTQGGAWGVSDNAGSNILVCLVAHGALQVSLKLAPACPKER